MLRYALALIWILASMAFVKSAVHDIEMGLYVNKSVPYGEEVSVVVTLSVLPDHNLTLRVSTSVYLVGYWIAAPTSEAMNPRFTHTANITKELGRLKIEPRRPITKVDVYFAVLKAAFWQKSKQKLTLTGVIDILMPRLAKKTAEFRVNWPFTCLPQMHPIKGRSPDNPHKILLNRSTLVSVEFDETCGLNDMDLSWILTDLLETKKWKDLGNQSFEYYIQPYSLRYPTNNELWRNLYVIKISGMFNNTIFQTRSYLRVHPEKVHAEIAGGHLRSIFLNEQLKFDGSSSRDLARAPKEKQFEKYHWTCKSFSDVHNRNCWKKTWTDAKFSLHPHALKTNRAYVFTLMVQSDFNPNLKAYATQVIFIVPPNKEKSLSVAIICVANCENNYYNADIKVLLLADCTHCKGTAMRYAWYLDNRLASEDNQLNMYIRTNVKSVQVELVAKANDGRQTAAKHQLLRIEPPSDGFCTVSPNEGTEVITQFFVCCQNFKTAHTPLQFFYYAGQVLLNECTNCRCPVYLTREVKMIQVLVCDHLLACSDHYLGIKVNPLEVTDKKIIQDDIWKFINTAPNSLTDLTDQSKNLHLLTKIQWIVNQKMKGSLALKLISILGSIHARFLNELSNLANLTTTFAHQLTPTNNDEFILLIYSLRKLNANFQHILENGKENFLIEVPYSEVTAACVHVYNVMHHLTKQIEPPPQSLYDQYRMANKDGSLNEIYMHKLFNEISTYNSLEAQERSIIWLNAMWETKRLYKFLDLGRKFGYLLDSASTNTAGVSLQEECIRGNPDEVIRIRTNDQMHEVTFSTELLQEVKDPNYDEICIRLISTIRELNWWYPEEKHPSTVMLSVRIYSDAADIQEKRQLSNSEISFKTVIAKYKPAIGYPTTATMEKRARSQIDSDSGNDVPKINSTEGNPEEIASLVYGDEDDIVTDRYLKCLRYGKLDSEQQVLIYRINLDEHSMVIARFISSTHKLRVLFFVDKLPKKLREAIASSQCTVPAHSTNAELLLRNNCMAIQRVYMAVQLYKDKDDGNESLVPGTPAEFSFVFQVRTCDNWSYGQSEDSQCWEHQDCKPGLNKPEKGTMYCTCNMLGTYTSYAFHVPAILVPMADYVPLQMNWALFIIYLLILAALFLMLVYLFMKHNKLFSKTITCDMTDLDRSDQEVHDLLIYIRTGGQDNAGTTATVRIIFQTQTRHELLFTLMQDPEKPELKRNSTYILWLRSRDIRIPTRIAISHNNFGRYPSWFVQRIDIVDIQAQLMQIFHVRRWVRNKYLILSSALVIRPGDVNISAENWRGRFNNEIERQWINWGLWQPLTGSWRSAAIYDNLTRAQRVCIFVNKMLVAFCVCACVIGETTPETMYEDSKLSIDVSNLVIMTAISIILTNLVQYLLIKLINVKL